MAASTGGVAIAPVYYRPVNTIERMALGLTGRRALVTGATRGIGLAIARALAAEGAQVGVAARTASDVRRVVDEIGGFAVVADLATEDGCREAASQAGPLQVLVNNLGLRAGPSWQDTAALVFEQAMAGNLLPAGVRTVCVDMNPAVVTKLADRGSWQSIGLVTDVESFLRELVSALESEQDG